MHIVLSRRPLSAALSALRGVCRLWLAATLSMSCGAAPAAAPVAVGSRADLVYPTCFPRDQFAFSGIYAGFAGKAPERGAKRGAGLPGPCRVRGPARYRYHDDVMHQFNAVFRDIKCNGELGVLLARFLGR